MCLWIVRIILHTPGAVCPTVEVSTNDCHPMGHRSLVRSAERPAAGSVVVCQPTVKVNDLYSDTLVSSSGNTTKAVRVETLFSNLSLPNGSTTLPVSDACVARLHVAHRHGYLKDGGSYQPGRFFTTNLIVGNKV